MSDSSNRNFSRGGRGRNRGRTPSSNSLGTGSWRSAGAPAASTASDAGSGAPAAPAPPPPSSTPAPAPAASAGGQQAATQSNNKPRQRADSHRKQPSRNSSFSAAPPPITVTAPAAGAAQSPAPATATAATPQSASGRGSRKGGRSRKASAAGLVPIASSSSTLAPIASAPPNATGFGNKASIDSLVQHMRDSVKDHSGKDDWAQDNDDSLPDLDDWDVDSKSNVSGSSNVLTVKPTPSSIKTAPIGFQGMAAQQKAAKDKLTDGKKNKRSTKGKKDKGSEASPVSPLPPSPAVPAPALPPAARALNPTTVPAHPLAAIPPHRPPPHQVAVQLPSAPIKRVVENSPTGQTPLLPSPVFATLNPPFSGSNAPPARRSGQPGKGDWRSRDSARSGASSASAGKKDTHPHHLASNSAELGAIREEVLTANTVTKPKAPIEEPSGAESVVRLPSSPTGAAPPGPRVFTNGTSSSNPPSSGSSKAPNSSVPTTPKMNGGAGLPGSSHRRTPSTQSQTSAPHSPRQRPNQDARDVFTATHSRTHSTTRPKISVSALFQLNRSLATNGQPSVRAAPSPAVA
ncbi:hypothetical protein AURDEDRAFT_157017 [Auricularia subglabra TFB-10046 SS5]|nr:hypothetical protein AURDEDRAFT_157017 [Auricularia subglabra TFB-10046 SS5]